MVPQPLPLPSLGLRSSWEHQTLVAARLHSGSATDSRTGMRPGILGQMKGLVAVLACFPCPKCFWGPHPAVLGGYS